MNLSEWQITISEAANKKFPKNTEWSEFDRLDSIQRQLDDVIASIEVENGLKQSTDHAHQDPDHRIAALIADILILAQMRQADVEKELKAVLQWFKT